MLFLAIRRGTKYIQPLATHGFHSWTSLQTTIQVCMATRFCRRDVDLCVHNETKRKQHSMVHGSIQSEKSNGRSLRISSPGMDLVEASEL